MDTSLLTKAAPTSPFPKPPRSHSSFSDYALNPSPVKAPQPDQTAYDEDSTELSRNPLSPNITIKPTTPATLPSFRRVITLLLPIRYSDKFYKESISDPTSSSLSHVALWREKPRPGKRKRSSSPQSSTADSSSPPKTTPEPPSPIVVAGIQCRLEPVPSPNETEQHLYIETLGVLSPYRGLGIATHLLNTITATIIQHHKHVTEIYAHVWEANEEALGWYLRRGFVVEKEVVEGYYRRLRPGAARVVRRRVGVGDYLAVRRERGRGSGIGDMEKGGGIRSETPAENLILHEDARRESLESDVQKASET